MHEALLLDSFTFKEQYKLILDTIIIVIISFSLLAY